MNEPALQAHPNVDVAWHARQAESAAAALGVAPAAGLSSQEAASRLREHGANRLGEPPRRPAWLRLLLQFHNPLIYVLLASSIVTAVLGDMVDTAVILGVVVINAIIGHVQEGRAERALEAVRGMLAQRASVLRDGERRTVEAADLVPGDVVLLESGDRVPADILLLRAKNLRVVEAALTGESAPVEKSVGPAAQDAAVADRTCMCHAGTLVSFGQGAGIVVETGARTEIGRIGTLVAGVGDLATPLTRRLDRFARQVTGFILVLSALTLAYGHFVAGFELAELFPAVVGLAVAAIPEGLPAVVTIVLAIGTRAMARKRAIVRRLPAVEALGSVSVICTDKTGTLTRNEMTVVRVLLPGRELQVTGAGYAPEGGFHAAGEPVDPERDAALQALARCALLCNDARIHEAPGGGWLLAGDPTEGALVTLARKAGLDPADLALQWPRTDEIPFESERQYMATLHHDHSGRRLALLKGAPERVLALCSSQCDGQPLDTVYWERAVRRAAESGERVLALASAHWGGERPDLQLTDMTRRFDLLGLVGIIDPPRAEAIAAVSECRAAGIQVKMVTGDHALTAAAIGRQLGLASARVLTGEEIGRLDDAALARVASDSDVFARTSPEQKLRLVRALRANGHLVAMTGDGVNDAPALKAADIGVAMGGKGTDAAREASDLVLTDDNFATIAAAVREGRVVFDNIKKCLIHMLPTNGGQAGVILLAVLASLPLPVTASQILWINTVTAVTLALALAFEPGEPGVMTRALRPAGEPIVTRTLGMRVLFVIVLIVAAAFAIFEWELAQGRSLEAARTAVVNTIVVCEMFYLFNVRHFTQHAFAPETLAGNPQVLLVCGILAGLQGLFTYAPPMQAVFASTSLGVDTWLAILALGASVFFAVEAEKAWLRRSGVATL
ncbi:MAG: cation-translocating P-type ATPase [Gammaproteobacteria bacterium]